MRRTTTRLATTNPSKAQPHACTSCSAHATHLLPGCCEAPLAAKIKARVSAALAACTPQLRRPRRAKPPPPEHTVPQGPNVLPVLVLLCSQWPLLSAPQPRPPLLTRRPAAVHYTRSCAGTAASSGHRLQLVSFLRIHKRQQGWGSASRRRLSARGGQCACRPELHPPHATAISLCCALAPCPPDPH
jgi:hypothetical protein